MAHVDPKTVDLPALCDRVQWSFPKRFRKDSWYLTTTAALIASGKPGLVGNLYTYLTREYRTPVARQALVRRMREAMIKCIILNGIPTVMEAFAALANVEQAEDQEHSFTRQDWQADEKNHKRGLEALQILYREENDKIWSTFGSHRDIFKTTWISTDIRFLADHTILDIIESELVILPAIMCQNLKMAMYWHIHGCLHVGISRAEVEQIQRAIEGIAEACGKSLDKIGRISDIEEDC